MMSVKHKHKKKVASLGCLLIVSVFIGLSIVMREVVYKSDPAANWLGTVFGVFSLAVLCGLITFGILYLIFGRNTGGGWSAWGVSMMIMLVAFLAMIVGVVLAFLPPFKQLFRVNAFLYYGLGLIAVFMISAAIFARVNDRALKK